MFHTARQQPQCHGTGQCLTGWPCLLRKSGNPNNVTLDGSSMMSEQTSADHRQHCFITAGRYDRVLDQRR
jgi:hypothetical protein